MAKLSKECKKMMVEEVSSRLKDADTLIVTNYKGLTSQELNELRRTLREVSSEYIVVKDSMAKRALAEGPNNRIVELINGEIGIAVDKKEDPSGISKILVKFSKDHDVLKIQGGIVKGECFSKEDIVTFAMLPSREVLLSRLANVLNAPLQGLAGALNAILTKILYALNAVKDKKEEAKEEIQPEAKETSPQPEPEKKEAPKPEDKEDKDIKENKS